MKSTGYPEIPAIIGCVKVKEVALKQTGFVEKERSNGAADEGELLFGVAAAVVHIKFGRYPMCSHGILKHLLEVVDGMVIEEPADHQEPGRVIDDRDTV